MSEEQKNTPQPEQSDQQEQKTVTFTYEEAEKILDRQDQMISDLVACYQFLEKLQTIHEMIGGNMTQAAQAMAIPKKREQIQEVMGGRFEDLANRMSKYESYVRSYKQSQSQEQGGADEQ
jgi:hypothetical protein